MRLLTFSNCDLVETQGSGYVVVNFARGLQRRGHSVQLLGPNDYLSWPRLRKARSLRLAFGLYRKAIRLVRESKPDLVEFYGAEAWLASDRLSRLPNRQFKVVAHSNGLEPLMDETLKHANVPNTAHGEPPRWYQGRLRYPGEYAFSKVDAIVTVSHPEADYAIAHKLQPSERVLAIENALSEEFIAQPAASERSKTIGFCGSWLARKGTALLVASLPSVLRQFPEWRLHLVGVGEHFCVEAHFPTDIYSQITVTSFVRDKEDLRRIYQSWAIALAPSVYESFGLAAAESMACGCALLGTRTGFPASLKHEDEALLMDDFSSRHLHDGIVRLIQDPELRKMIALNGWKRVQCLSWDRNISALEAFYSELLKQPNQTSKR